MLGTVRAVEEGGGGFAASTVTRCSFALAREAGNSAGASASTGGHTIPYTPSTSRTLCSASLRLTALTERGGAPEASSRVPHRKQKCAPGNESARHMGQSDGVGASEIPALLEGRPARSLAFAGIS